METSITVNIFQHVKKKKNLNIACLSKIYPKPCLKSKNYISII